MKFEFSIDVPAPIEKVWNFAQDPNLRPQWDVRILEYQLSGPLQAGTCINMLLKFPLFKIKVKGSLTYVQYPYQTIIRIDSVKPPFFPKGGGTWLFKEQKNGTRFTSRFTLTPGPWKYLYLWSSYVWIRYDTLRSLKNLKQLILRDGNFRV